MDRASLKRVRAKMSKIFEEARVEKSEAGVYAVLSQGAAMAQTMTPIDTSTLTNSQYEPQISVRRDGVSGSVGYTAAYAAAVHESEGTLAGELRDPNNPGRGTFWSPDAEPKFLERGFEEIESSIPRILKEAYRV